MAENESGFDKFMNQRKAGAGDTGLGSVSRSDLLNELDKRDKDINPFPLDVFPPAIKPFIDSLCKYYDLPRSFVGLTLLSCYSTAIGTAYAVTSNRRDVIYLPVWACLLGISSSGKSVAMNQILKPLYKIQEDMDFEWKEKTDSLTMEKRQWVEMKMLVYRDGYIPTLIRSVLPDNPKGVLKIADELIEWINGLNALGRGKGTDEQFWLSSYNCSLYSAIRSGKEKFVIPRPFVNVIGGLQYGILHKLFSSDRDVTGFVYRLLFAIPETDKIADIDSSFQMPDEFYDVHDKAIRALYNVSVFDSYEDPRLCVISDKAIKLFIQWRGELRTKINRVEDAGERDARSGIYGKICEYVQRFAAILALMDKALKIGKGNSGVSVSSTGGFDTYFKQQEEVLHEHMERAIRLGEYFYHTAWEAYTRVEKQMTAPRDVLVVAAMLKSNRSYKDIGEFLFPAQDISPEAKKQKTYRLINKYIKEYPRVFGAFAK